MKVLMFMTVVTLFLVFVLPKLQGYMRMLIQEHDEMENL